jgi:predicted nucleotidyltransferase
MRSPLSTVFGGSRARVLEALLELETGLSVREVARLTGLSATTASTALSSLAEIGMLSRQVLGQSLRYQINLRHAFVGPLRGLAARARDMDDVVAGEVNQALPEAVALWVYGSRAVGTERPDSDTDLLAIFLRRQDAEDAAAQAARIAERLRDVLGSEVSLICLEAPTAEEWLDPFWRNVLRTGVSLDGPEPTHVRELGAMKAAEMVPSRVGG